MVISKKVDYYNPYPAIPAFHRIFLYLVERFGKVYELGLALLINLKMLTPFKDIDMASPMFMKGKAQAFSPFQQGAEGTPAGHGPDSENGTNRKRIVPRSGA